MGAPKKNRKRPIKRKSSNKTTSSLLARLKATGVTATIIALASFGLWRCLGEDSGAVLEPYHQGRTSRVIDVGKGKKPDPTIVNEQLLLENERQNSDEIEREKAPLKPTGPAEGRKDTVPRLSVEISPIEPEPVDPFPNYAVAFHFHTQVFSIPDKSSPAVAYARRGATFRVSERVSTNDCPKGWYEIAPGNLFACNGEGILVGNEPQTFAPSPPAADLDAPLPYKYAYVTRDKTPQFWRVPTAEELEIVKGILPKDKLEIVQDAGPTVSTPLGDSTTLTDAGTADNGEYPPYLYQIMQKGYFVSIDNRPSSEGDELFQSTVRGRFLPSSSLSSSEPSSFSGVLLGGANTLPAVYVTGSGVSMLKREGSSEILKKSDPIARFSWLPFLGELKRQGRSYVQVGEQHYLSSRVAAIVRKSEPPPKLAPKERWIDVNLSEQTLVAYEGDKPVFATLVSTGKEGFPTPEGVFRIYSKHISITMDDPGAGEEAYSIEDVPWTQYFNESYAIHAAFWHNRFGRRRSHGCINLSPRDAHRLFSWTGPHLPRGLHGVSANKANPGTRISIHN